MGYDANVGYAVGTIFDFAKGLLPLALAALLTRRALGIAAILGAAWICLVVFSCLATHATVTTAISAIERTGTWKMEVRGNTKAELASVEQQLAALSRPSLPRPAKTVQEALAAERVPPSVWQDSQECGRIQESAHFARACAQVVQLRRELAAALDYERLSSRATELRKGLAAVPIVATADPLPAAFSATLGRVLPIGGTEGVALLITTVVEVMSGFGLAGISALRREHSGRPGKGIAAAPSLDAASAARGSAAVTPRSLPERREATLPIPSLKAVAPEGGRVRVHATREASNPPSNILPMRPRPPSRALASEGASLSSQTHAEGGNTATDSNVSVFSGERLHKVEGTSIAFSELRSCYEVWCAERGENPLSLPRFAAALKALGFKKWKSSGLIRYRGLQIAARSDGSHAVTLRPQVQPV
jgi:hypothetical protein